MERYYRTRMAASQEALEVELLENTGVDTPWFVVLFNDEVHAFDEVVIQVMRAAGCSLQRAAEVTLQAHTAGKADAYAGPFEECLRVGSVLGEIGLLTEIKG